MLRTKTLGREVKGGIEEGGEEVRDKEKRSCRRDVGNEGDLGGNRKIVDKKGLVQYMPI